MISIFRLIVCSDDQEVKIGTLDISQGCWERIRRKKKKKKLEGGRSFFRRPPGSEEAGKSLFYIPAPKIDNWGAVFSTYPSKVRTSIFEPTFGAQNERLGLFDLHVRKKLLNVGEVLPSLSPRIEDKRDHSLCETEDRRGRGCFEEPLHLENISPIFEEPPPFGYVTRRNSSPQRSRNSWCASLQRRTDLSPTASWRGSINSSSMGLDASYFKAGCQDATDTTGAGPCSWLATPA